MRCLSIITCGLFKSRNVIHHQRRVTVIEVRQPQIEFEDIPVFETERRPRSNSINESDRDRFDPDSEIYLRRLAHMNNIWFGNK